MNRGKRTTIAAETVAIQDAGGYTSSGGRHVSIAESLQRSVANMRTVAPEEWQAILDAASMLPRQKESPAVEVTPETTLAAGKRLWLTDPSNDLLALNFASAKNPGGGFLTGSQAQEESLARASGLYNTLLAAEPYYRRNRQCGTVLYTDHAILSPQVPVFRDDDATLLDEPWPLSMYTAPAPNRGAMVEGSSEAKEIVPTFKRRMTHLFALAATTGHRRLILGAWGCGVFRNDPAEVAECFADTLFREGWASYFSHLCFAVFDTTENRSTYAAFERVLAPHMRKEKP